jgi:hypothetical protein
MRIASSKIILLLNTIKGVLDDIKINEPICSKGIAGKRPAEVP